MDSEVVTVVSGLPRSGTSMLMKMLEAGGLDVLQDHVRTADVDNPKGYYEFERVKKLPEDTAWLPEAQGKVVKVLAELVTKLPEGYNYKVVFIRRNLNEILASQKKMIIRRGEDPDAVSDDELKQLFNMYLNILKSWIEEQPHVDVMYVNYNEIMMDATETVPAIDDFLGGGMDTDAMLEAVDSSLYRNRA